MSVFTILTVRKIRESIVRPIQLVAASDLAVQLAEPQLANYHQQTKFRRKRDRQLFRLALFQVISYIVLNITTSIYPLYSYLTRPQSATDADQQAIGVLSVLSV